MSGARTRRRPRRSRKVPIDSGLAPVAKRLVSELQSKLGLNDVDARRAAFVCLATQKGWTKARIGRYLGVSRSRIGQRVDKYKEYAGKEKSAGGLLYPQITKVFAKLDDPQPDNKLVTFKREQWNNREFAIQVINHLVNFKPKV